MVQVLNQITYLTEVRQQLGRKRIELLIKRIAPKTRKSATLLRIRIEPGHLTQTTTLIRIELRTRVFTADLEADLPLPKTKTIRLGF